MLGQTFNFSHFLFMDTATDLPIMAYKKRESWECTLLPKGAELSKGVFRQLVDWKIRERAQEEEDLLQIVLGMGPGSYAGIRAGTTIAQALGFALKIPVHRMSSLDWLLPDKEGDFTACIDAKAGGIYAQKKILLKGKSVSRGEVIHYENTNSLFDHAEQGTRFVSPVSFRGEQGWQTILYEKKLSILSVFDPREGIFCEKLSL